MRVFVGLLAEQETSPHCVGVSCISESVRNADKTGPVSVTDGKQMRDVATRQNLAGFVAPAT